MQLSGVCKTMSNEAKGILKQFLWTDKVQIGFFGEIKEFHVGRKEGAGFSKKEP